MDAPTFDALVREWRPALTRYAATFVGKANAEDVVQIAFLRTWMFDAPIEYPGAFLFRVVRNAALNVAKTLDTDTSELGDWHTDGRSAADIAHQRMEAAAALAAIAALKPAERDRFVLSITRRHGSTTLSGQERQAVWRTRAALRAELGRESQESSRPSSRGPSA